MELFERKPPRKFTVGANQPITLKDCGRLHLHPNEQISLVTQDHKEHDFVCKDWGYYATPSINSRLKDQGLKTALVRNTLGKVYIMSVDADKMTLFDLYILSTQQEVLEWLDERPLEGEE